jgi:hypothetical protein
MVWECLIVWSLLGLFFVGLFWLHCIQYLANVIMATTACKLLQGENDIWPVMLAWQPELLFTVGLKDHKGISGCLVPLN